MNPEEIGDEELEGLVRHTASAPPASGPTRARQPLIDPKMFAETVLRKSDFLRVDDLQMQEMQQKQFERLLHSKPKVAQYTYPSAQQDSQAGSFGVTGVATAQQLRALYDQQVLSLAKLEAEIIKQRGIEPIAEKEEIMLAKILRLYHASMAGDVRSPLVHLVGPPGCGKSTSVEQAAHILGVRLHILNVSRISPLEIEGVQMPVDGNTRLEMLLATFWNELEEGDIVLLDEFLRGFPEVYNGLLDILTSRRVGKHVLPKVFFIGASNSTATYDKALEDRLLHLPVDDPRSSKGEKKRLAEMLASGIGLLPEMASSFQMDDLLDQEVLPMYEMLDLFKGKANISSQSIKGHSLRHLIGQVWLRQVESTQLKELVAANNRKAMTDSKFQYVVLLDGKKPDPTYVTRAQKLQGNPRLTEIQARNLDLNLQLIGMEEAMKEIVNEEEVIADGELPPF